MAAEIVVTAGGGNARTVERVREKENRRVRQSSSVSGFLTGRKRQSITPGGFTASAPHQDTRDRSAAQERRAFSLLISLNSIDRLAGAARGPDPARAWRKKAFSVAKLLSMWDNGRYPKNGVRRRDPPRAGAEGARREESRRNSQAKGLGPRCLLESFKALAWAPTG
jgi:hypothetical protein